MSSRLVSNRLFSRLLFTSLLGSMFLWSVAGCAPREAVRFRMRSWGGMRAVLHDGQSQARVRLNEIVSDDTVAVGVAVGVSGEITVDRGTITVASVRGQDVALHRGNGEEQAALLLAADVARWDRYPLPKIADLRALEDEIRRIAQEARLAPGAHGIPFRVEGDFTTLSLHVVNGSCPRANPSGPQPWRLDRARAAGTLIGFYVEGQAGRMTHPGERSHVHAVAEAAGREVSGHVDSVAIEEGATLYLPASGR